jgi:hypothetical protein
MEDKTLVTIISPKIIKKKKQQFKNKHSDLLFYFMLMLSAYSLFQSIHNKKKLDLVKITTSIY